ncbi:afadin- and alpha-actinin-binding protein-like isoform X1 [Pleurodeles waltl]|uniref:afadin- and alpha-actinin-binding protein-like isoform X1 n=1 Tax=Pleurodeles waltl TaxID=8319 RepID=UPI00370956C6
MSKSQRTPRPFLQKEPVIKLDMKEEDDILRTLVDLEKQMLELMLENLELRQDRDRMIIEVEGLYRRLSPTRHTTSQDSQCYSLSMSQDSRRASLDFSSQKLRGEDKSNECVQEQATSNIKSQWRQLRRHIEKLRGQGSRPAGQKRERDLVNSVTDHDKELAKVKEELREMKLKMGGRWRTSKSQDQELQELRWEVEESKRLAETCDLELEELRQEVAESCHIVKKRTLELEDLRQEMEKNRQTGESRDQELAALRQEIEENRRKVVESPELEDLRQEIAASRELICQQQQLLQEQLASSLSSDLPTPIRGSYFLEEQLRLQEDRAAFEEQKRIFQVERRNFTEAAIRLGREKKKFDEERGLLAKHCFLNSTSAVVEAYTPPWTRGSSQATHSLEAQTRPDATVLIKPSSTSFSRHKASGSSTPKCVYERRPLARTMSTPSTAEAYRGPKWSLDQRLLATVGTELHERYSGRTTRMEYKNTPAWKRGAPVEIFSPDALPDYILHPTSNFSPSHIDGSSSVETTPVFLSKSRSSLEDTGPPSTAELYRVLGLTARSSQLSDHRSLVSGSERDSLEAIPHEETSPWMHGNALAQTERKIEPSCRMSGSTPPAQTEHYSEICSNLLSRFLDASF